MMVDFSHTSLPLSLLSSYLMTFSIWFLSQSLLSGNCVCLCRHAWISFPVCVHKNSCYSICVLETHFACLHAGRERVRVCVLGGFLSLLKMCCRKTPWSFSSQLITPWDHKTRCDNAQCSSASGTGILIDVKATKHLRFWWVQSTDKVNKMVPRNAAKIF